MIVQGMLAFDESGMYSTIVSLIFPSSNISAWGVLRELPKFFCRSNGLPGERALIKNCILHRYQVPFQIPIMGKLGDKQKNYQAVDKLAKKSIIGY